MKTAMAAIGIGSALLWLAAASAAPATDVPAPSVQRQIQKTQTELQQQRAQSGQLKQRVNGLEKRSADDRSRLDQRDREIAELQRKLDALSGKPAATPRPASGRSR